MSKYRTNVLFESLVVVFLTIYLFYASTNLFFIPNYTSGISNTTIFSGPFIRRQTFQARHDAITLISIGDKSIILDDRLDVIKSVPVILLFILNGFGFLTLRSKLISPQTIVYHILEYPYLSFCKLRI